jgi:hypothetical protein
MRYYFGVEPRYEGKVKKQRIRAFHNNIFSKA